jgi:hypothetical protein
MKRIRVEVYAGFVMQLIGDQMVSDDGGPSRLITLMNKKYKRKIRAACSDRPTYDELRADLSKTKFKDTIVSHLFSGVTCSHFVYYDSIGNRYDSYTTGRQCDMTNQFCQNHALLMAYEPDLRDDESNYIDALYQLSDFWEENLVDIMKITSQEDFNNNIHNLRMTNINEKDEKLFLYGDSLIMGIKSMITKESPPDKKELSPDEKKAKEKEEKELSPAEKKAKKKKENEEKKAIEKEAVKKLEKQFETLTSLILDSLFEDEETLSMMANW